jgi:Uma2 family endonuclease
MNTITLKLPHLSTEDFIEICQENEDLQLEKTAKGELSIMSPTYSWTGKINFILIAQLSTWIDKTNLGIGFDSSSGFTLPDGSIKSPDVSWISNENWDKLTETEQKNQFSPIAPDFIIELRSSSDSLKKLQSKMREYQQNGVKLGWLIDTVLNRVEIYRQNKEMEILESPNSISGEDILPEFVLDLTKIWD